MGGVRGVVSSEERQECLMLIDEACAAGARRERACEELGLSMRTLQRWIHQPVDNRKGPTTKPANALTEEERCKLLAIANSKEFADLSPWQIVPKLADRGEYIASESTFYRVLKSANCLQHREKSMPRKHQRPQELIAHSPNEIWSWDITFLKAAIKGTFYYLYLPMDIFSRLIVHWEVHEVQSEVLASEMITRACEMHKISSNQIVLHSDNGGPMKGATMLATLQRLGVMPSFSRPKVSDDNPFSESLFKTVKYCPSYPENGFESLDDAKKWVASFVQWYNNQHYHSGIRWVTPASRHQGEDIEILNNRKQVYEQAKAANPIRWSKKTRNWNWINEVELNPGKQNQKTSAQSQIRTADKIAAEPLYPRVRAGCSKNSDSTTRMGVSQIAS